MCRDHQSSLRRRAAAAAAHPPEALARQLCELLRSVQALHIGVLLLQTECFHCPIGSSQLAVLQRQIHIQNLHQASGTGCWVAGQGGCPRCRPGQATGRRRKGEGVWWAGGAHLHLPAVVAPQLLHQAQRHGVLAADH